MLHQISFIELYWVNTAWKSNSDSFLPFFYLFLFVWSSWWSTEYESLMWRGQLKKCWQITHSMSLLPDRYHWELEYLIVWSHLLLLCETLLEKSSNFNGNQCNREFSTKTNNSIKTAQMYIYCIHFTAFFSLNEH